MAGDLLSGSGLPGLRNFMTSGVEDKDIHAATKQLSFQGEFNMEPTIKPITIIAPEEKHRLIDKSGNTKDAEIA